MHIHFFLVATATAASRLAQGGVCDTSASCTYDLEVNGRVQVINFRRLCNPGQDYTKDDGEFGHVYKAQICGQTGSSCLPRYYNTLYQYGRVIQYIDAAPPPCDNACVDERTGSPTCCTGACEVPAIGPGVISALNGDPFQGVVLSYKGSSPTLNDPWSCPTNPATGDAFPRQTEMVFQCDTTVVGFAVLDSVTQNTTDSCDYTLRFRTNLVCFAGGRSQDGTLILPISGGWIFMTTLLTALGLYVIIGIIWGYTQTKSISFPHVRFWTEIQNLIFEGAVFACSCFSRRAVLSTSRAEVMQASAMQSKHNESGTGRVSIRAASTSSNRYIQRPTPKFNGRGFQTIGGSSSTDL